MIRLYLFVLSCLLSACQEDKLDFADSSQEVKFCLTNSEKVSTRALGSTFDTGDKIGIYIVRHMPNNSPVLQASGNYADNKCYNIAAGILTANSESDKIYASQDGYSYSIYAYYPYNPNIINPRNIAFQIPTNQTTEAYFKNADFMIAQTLNTSLTIPVELNFKRKLSVISLNCPKNPNKNITSISLPLISNCQINLQTSTLTESYSESTLTGMWKYNESPNDLTYLAVIPPYNFKNDVKFHVQANEHEFIYSTSNIKFSEGTVNTFYMIEKQRHIQCKVVSDYETGGRLSNYDAYVIDGNTFSVTAYPENGYVFEGWYNNNLLVSKDLNYTFTVTQDVELEARFYVTYKINITTNIDTNILYASGVSPIKGAGTYRRKEIMKTRIEIDPGTEYVFYCWKENGKLIGRDWDYNALATRDINLEAVFVKSVYHDYMVSEELSFISNNNFDFHFPISNRNVQVPPGKTLMNTVYVYFDGEKYDFARYGFWKKWLSASYNGNLVLESSAEGRLGIIGSEKTKTFTITYNVNMHYGLSGNIPIRGRVYIRIFGYWWEDSM